MDIQCLDGIVNVTLPEEELLTSYLYFQENETWSLPFTTDLVNLWAAMHENGDFYLRRREDMKELLDFLGVVSMCVRIKPWQITWSEALFNMMNKHRIALDTSPLGAGKTYTSINCAKTLGCKHVIIVCPASLLGTYEDMRCVIPHLSIITYGKLRGKTSSKLRVDVELKHGLLLRRDIIEEDEPRRTYFTSTPLLKLIAQEGAYLIVDEVQNIKNASDQQNAVKSLISAFRARDNCYVNLLSGSPFDKIEGAFRMMYTLGLTSVEELVHINSGRMALTGLSEAIRSSRNLERIETGRSSKTDKITAILPVTKLEATKMAWKLYTEVVAPYITGSCGRPTIEYEHDIANGFYTLSDQQALKYLVQLSDIRSSIKKDNNGNMIGYNFTTLGRCLKSMEECCIPTIATEVSTTLRTVQGSQCVIFITYIDNYDLLLSLIDAKYGIEVLNGAVPPNKRSKIIDRFQEGKSRVIIVGVEVGGAGLSLHDRTGNRPRYSWIVPTYSGISMYQCTGRIYRPGTSSPCRTRYVYCRQYPANKILNLIQVKSTTIRESLCEGANYVLLPDDYANLCMPENTPFIES